MPQPGVPRWGWWGHGTHRNVARPCPPWGHIGEITSDGFSAALLAAHGRGSVAECSPTGSWRGPSRSVGFLESCSQPSTSPAPPASPRAAGPGAGSQPGATTSWAGTAGDANPSGARVITAPALPQGRTVSPVWHLGTQQPPTVPETRPAEHHPPLAPAPFGAHGVQGVPRPHPQRGMKGGFGGRRAFREHHLRSEGSLWLVRGRGDGSRDANRALLLARRWAARVLQRCGEEEGDTRTRSGRARGWRCARPPGSTASERRWHEGGRRLKQPLMKPEINRAASRRAALYLQEDDGAEAARRPRPRPASDGAVRGGRLCASPFWPRSVPSAAFGLARGPLSPPLTAH